MLRAYAGEGLPPIEVIRAATSNAAELLGWQDRIGILEKGKYADVIAVPGNPLSDVNTFDHVLFVMKEGKIIRNDIKQTERKVAEKGNK
jgi:imidazolonepropionase-like amidohydrolase